MSRHHVLQSLDILPPVVRHPEKYAAILRNRRNNPEQLLLLRWKEEGLFSQVQRFERMMFTCGTLGDMNTGRQFSEEKPEGVRLKYAEEYNASYKTCGYAS